MFFAKYEADAWRVGWYGYAIRLAHCFLHSVCVCEILYSEPSPLCKRSPTSLCLPFLFAFVSCGSLLYFFSGSLSYVSPGAMSSSQHTLIASSTLRCE